MQFFILFFLLCVSMFSQNASAQLAVHESEADEYLEGNADTSLSTVYDAFIEKGGTIIRLENDVPPFQFIVGDVVFPACSGGNNRSQTLWAMLRPYESKITLNPPHATRYGFDSYNGIANWNRTLHLQKNDEFILWSGFAKSPKLGWNVFKEWLSKDDATAEELAKMKEYYTRHYFNPPVPEGARRVYITFAKNAHAHIFRLVETNKSLENVVLLVYPVEDLIHRPLPEWDTYPRSVKAYIELSKILKVYLDFSQLNDPV